MMLAFICLERPEWQIQVVNYKPPEKDERSRYPAKINKNQFVLMQMSSVDDGVGDDLEMMSPCPGSLETEILPLLTSNVIATEVCTMFYIEKIGEQIVYR